MKVSVVTPNGERTIMKCQTCRHELLVITTTKSATHDTVHICIKLTFSGRLHA